MAKKLKFLETNNFIKREVDEYDGRVFRFSLTKKSIESIEKIDTSYNEAIACIFHGSSEIEISLVSQHITKWTENLLRD
jgi:DNA-binding MarR family transcriptional regulator